MRKLTRLQSIITGGAFALAGIGGVSASTLGAQPASAAPVGDPAAVTIEQPTQAQASAPSQQDLHPMPISGTQRTFTPDHEQLANTKAIVDTAKELHLPPRAWTIAVATSLQEANLHNVGDLGSANDHDSLGLFQQRPSTGGWGTAEQIQDPHHAASKFLTRLTQLDGWQDMPLTKAAQKVQVSAYPEHYAKHETQAGDMIDALYGTGPYAQAATDLR